jgi:SAM-dependent methyltransferase
VSSAWDRFWADDRQAGGGGCLPGPDNRIERVQAEAWRAFAAGLPRHAKLLDLGTGDGRVMRWMIEARRDLKPVGVDYAERIPPAPRGSRSRGGVRIEALPFGDSTFDAVTSQFGIEYADTNAAVAELARVLRPGGRFRLIVHRADGPLVRHNLARLEGLEWAAGASGALQNARRLVGARAVANLPTPPSFAELVSEGRSRFGRGSAAEEFTLAVLQTLEGSRGGPPREALEALDELARLAEDEASRIRHLAASAFDQARLERFTDRLRAVGAPVDSARELGDATDIAGFAWLIDGSKP